MHVTDDPLGAAVLAPRGRDAEIIAGLLRDDGIEAAICPDIPALIDRIGRSGLAILTEESLPPPDLSRLAAALAGQPDWSDFPLILLTLAGGGPDRRPSALRTMQALGNVTFLERPFQGVTFVSLARTALASRRRQYQARDRMDALEASRSEVARGDERLKFALEAGKLGAWDLDLRDRSLEASDLCKANFGLGPEAMLNYETFLAILHPEDCDRVLAEAQVAIDTGSDYEVECRVTTPAGEVRWVELRGRAIYEEGRPARIAGVSLDVTGRKHAAERQDLLIRELHHRVKNTLSTVQAIVGSTARGALTIDDFYRDFTGRIMSLANTHTILTEEMWQRASLREMLAKELDLFDNGQGRVQVEGPDVDLPSDYAVPIGMAFHELATNAAKYGALSNDHGRVRVAWTVEGEGAMPRVQLGWQESGGPPVKAPTRQGFGTRLLQRVLTAQVKADVEIDYRPAGLTVSVGFNLPDRARDGAPHGWK